MKSSGLKTLESLKIDWKNKDCFSYFFTCPCLPEVGASYQKAIVDPKKQIQGKVDSTSPFMLRYAYGSLR